MIRAPRHGDQTPPVDDAPTKLRQHIRQCRRVSSALEQLLSYTRTRSESALEAALETWSAVIHAPGFQGNFTTFVWNHFGIQIPEFIDTHDAPILRLLSLQMNLQQPSGVHQLASAREHSHKLFLNDDWSKGGKFHALEIKPPPKPEIAMMDLQEPGTVTRLRHAKNGPFWVFCERLPPPAVRALRCNGIRYTVIGRNGNQLRLSKPIPGPTACVKVVFLSPTSDTSLINHLTLQFWEQYWQGTDEPDLHAITEALGIIPSIPAFAEYCTPTEVQEAIAQSKPARARGPDNWSNEDLKLCLLCWWNNYVRFLTQLWNKVHGQQAYWSLPLLSYPKKRLFKVLMILGLLQYYLRCTVFGPESSHVSFCVTHMRFCHLQEKAIDSKLPLWLASHIQLHLEHSLWFGLECNVASVDLKKAFNLISRKILAQTGSRFGVPPRVVDLHQSFLQTLTRSFRVAQQISPGMKSDRRVPEGCGFSVCAMLQQNWIMSAKLELDSTFNPNAQFYNYVDNWLFMSHARTSLLHSLGLVHDFAPKGCFRISSGKTWVSSTSLQARKDFQSVKFAGVSVSVPIHKVEIGLLLRFNKKACTGPVSHRWEAARQTRTSSASQELRPVYPTCPFVLQYAPGNFPIGFSSQEKQGQWP